MQAIEKRDRTIERLFSLLEQSSADTEQANQNCFILYSEIERLEGFKDLSAPEQSRLF